MSAHKSHRYGNKIVKHNLKQTTTMLIISKEKQILDSNCRLGNIGKVAETTNIGDNTTTVQKAMKWVSPDDFGEYNFC